MSNSKDQILFESHGELPRITFDKSAAPFVAEALGLVAEEDKPGSRYLYRNHVVYCSSCKAVIRDDNIGAFVSEDDDVTVYCHELLCLVDASANGMSCKEALLRAREASKAQERRRDKIARTVVVGAIIVLLWLVLCCSGCGTFQRAFKYEADRHIKKVTIAELEPLVEKKIAEQLETKMGRVVDEKVGGMLWRVAPWLLGGGGSLVGVYGLRKNGKNGKKPNEATT